MSDMSIFRLEARLRTRELFSPSATASCRGKVGVAGEILTGQPSHGEVAIWIHRSFGMLGHTLVDEEEPKGALLNNFTTENKQVGSFNMHSILQNIFGIQT